MRYYFLLLLLFNSCARSVIPLEPQQVHQQEVQTRRLLERAVEAMRRGTERDLKEAESALLLARAVKPRDSRVADGLGSVAWRRGDDKLAEHFFKQALVFDYRYDRAYAHLALVASKRGDLTTARELLQIATEMNPTNYRSRNNLAVVLARTGDNQQQAREELEKAIHILGEPDVLLERNKGLFGAE